MNIELENHIEIQLPRVQGVDALLSRDLDERIDHAIVAERRCRRADVGALALDLQPRLGRVNRKGSCGEGDTHTYND